MAATLTAHERRTYIELLRRQPLWAPLAGPQTAAIESPADIVGFGGSAGGGKTDLVCGLAAMHHQRSLIVRREKAQNEGIIQRMAEIVGTQEGLNGQKGIWKLPKGRKGLVEFGGLDLDGDERRWQGRPHDLKAFDEVTEMREQQVRFVMGWNRTPDPTQRTRVIMTFNPPTSAEGRWVLRFFGPWLDKRHPRPAMPGELRWFTTIGEDEDYEVENGMPFILVDGVPVYDFDPKAHKPEDIIRPRSRTFIPSRVTDNPYYMKSGYIQQLQALPEPLRSRMLYGDFSAGVEDGEFAMYPTEWVDAAMARWHMPDKLPPMDSVGLDVARGGPDKTVIVTRHGLWFGQPVLAPGVDTPSGAASGSIAMMHARDRARLHVDAVGVGAATVDWLRERGQPVVPVNVGVAIDAKDCTGSFEFANLRAFLMWKLREALDPQYNSGIALYPSTELAEEMAAITWSVRGKIVSVPTRKEIVKTLGRSPDLLSAHMLALMDTPDADDYEDAVLGRFQRDPTHQRDYDPFEGM